MAPNLRKDELVKRAQVYAALVERRKNCHLCIGLCNPYDIERYRHLDTEIGPWSQWQGNLDATLMIVGQDWGSVKFLESKFLGGGAEDRSNPTNKRLVQLLANENIDIDWKWRGRNSRLFFTNAVLCLRSGASNMQGKPNKDWFKNCVSENFLREQIKIVNPKVVVGLGRLAFDSILRSFGLQSAFPSSITLSEIVQDKSGVKLGTTRARAFAVYHCGAAGWNINRTEQQHYHDWKRIRKVLELSK